MNTVYLQLERFFFKIDESVFTTQTGFRAYFRLRRNDAVPDRKFCLLTQLEKWKWASSLVRRTEFAETDIHQSLKNCFNKKRTVSALVQHMTVTDHIWKEIRQLLEGPNITTSKSLLVTHKWQFKLCKVDLLYTIQGWVKRFAGVLW